MATGNFVLDKGYNAAAAITKFYAVKFVAGTPQTVTPVTAIADLVAGFAQFGVATTEITRGKGCPVRTAGITEAVATGAIPLGSQVQLESDGRVSALVGASGKRNVGRCVGNASTNAGDRISLMVDVNGPLA
jgi:hypothetical protein